MNLMLRSYKHLVLHEQKFTSLFSWSVIFWLNNSESKNKIGSVCLHFALLNLNLSKWFWDTSFNWRYSRSIYWKIVDTYFHNLQISFRYVPYKRPLPNQCPKRVIMILRKTILMSFRVHSNPCALKTSWPTIEFYLQYASV